MKFFQKTTLTVFVLALAAMGAIAQNSLIDERNVRAEMYFLASDAMQGRGSGSAFERVAAEYIGSQFMQFGLEPAGDPGFDGKPTFVQNGRITQNTFAGDPILIAGPTTFVNGKDILVLRANAHSLGTRLQKLNAGERPLAAAAVLMKVPDGGDIASAASAMIGAGALFVMVEETPQVRTSWWKRAARPISYVDKGPATRAEAVIALSKETAAAISALPDGTNIVFDAKLSTPLVQNTWNAIGKITGTDKTLASQVVLLTSHLDHLGVRDANPGPDKIFNGADDDASGSIAVLEMARLLASGKRPKRTVYFVCFGSEETGGFGANYFVEHLPFPKEKLVANLEFEMIGRPDDKVKPDELWLTGYERSNLGPELARRGAKLVQDPHPDQNFFQRSDNYTLARQGIVAHTVSSFGLHPDYHHASDEIKTIDFAHMTKSINSMVQPIQWLVNSNFTPTWNEGKKP